MHHVTLDGWSRIPSPIHRLDARAKIFAAFAVVVSVALSPGDVRVFGFYFLLVSVLVVAARLPVHALLLRASLVLPFALGVAVLNLFGGEPGRAAVVLGKSFLSAYTVLLLLGTTPLHALLRGLETLGVPRFFLMVAQFLYRYLFVLSEQAQHMILARRCRAPLGNGRASLSAAAGAVAVLFARSYARAERIHRAMLARGFQGHFVLLEAPALNLVDVLFMAIMACALGAAHFIVWTR